MGCSKSKAAGDPPASGGAASAGGEKASVDFLKNIPLFKRLPPDSLPALADSMETASYSQGNAIIKQGDEGNFFGIIKSGTCSVEIDGQLVANLKAKDFFGEMALLRDEPRTATIKATSPATCYQITREKFVGLGLSEKLDFPKRGAVGGGAGGEVVTKPPSPKNAEQKNLIKTALEGNVNLKTMVTLDEKKIGKMTEVMWEESVPKGTKVISEGDLEAWYFYIVMEGEFAVSLKKAQGGDGGDIAEAVNNVGTIKAGQSFGELALMYFAPRAATITASSDAKVMIIDRDQFKAILADEAAETAKKYLPFLDKVECLQCLTKEEKFQLAAALLEMSFSKHEVIFEQGEKGEHFFILIEGAVQVLKDYKEVGKVDTSSPNPYFGEVALSNNSARAATIKVTSDTATTLVVDKTSFDMLLGSLEDLKQRPKDSTAKVQKKVAKPSEDKRFGNIKRKDLKRLGLLGCGGFGAVEMVEHVSSGDTYALKALSKGYVVKSGMQMSVMSEKNVQLLCDSPFIIKLYETYNGEQSLYLLLELALGGELYATYNKKGMWGQEAHAKFYVAGTTFAFEHLHSKKIIFRDLKPENLLLNDQGRVKLTDMGLAKVVVGKTFTTCGTPDYFAPELIASKGHTHAVDWWTLGVLLFELLSGHPPFESATPMQIYQKVTKGINKVNFPKKCAQAAPLIKLLCHSSPSERLPMKKGGSNNIKTHAYFSGFNWQDMFNMTLPPPYKPVVKSKKDIANFNARKEDMPPQIPYKDPKDGWDKDFATST